MRRRRASRGRLFSSGRPYIVRWTTVPGKVRTRLFQSSTGTTAKSPPQRWVTTAMRSARASSRGCRYIRRAPNARAASATWVVRRGSRPGRCPTRRTETSGRGLRAEGLCDEPLDPVATVLQFLRTLDERLEPRRAHAELFGHVREEPALGPDRVVDLLLVLRVLPKGHHRDREHLRDLRKGRGRADVDGGVVEMVALVGLMPPFARDPARVDQAELLEERERLHPVRTELPLDVVEREPVLPEPLDELQLHRRVDRPEDRDEVAHVVDDLDSMHRRGHVHRPRGGGPRSVSSSIRRYFP